jgi:pimeloyl-ACP methyl ester carboxylesterase
VTRTDVRLSDATLPAWQGILPAWPGSADHGLFVRRGPSTGAEPAVFVHGLGGASTNWTDLMGLLGDAVDGIAMDLPGFGWSEPPAHGRYSLGVHVRAVTEAIERLDRGPVHLFGNSLGGAVSTRLAARRPDLVKTLTLVSPALPNVRFSRGADPRLALLAVPGLSQVITRRLAAQPPEARVRGVLELCYGDPSEIVQQRVDEAVEELDRRKGLRHSQDAMTGSLKGLIGTYVQRGSRNLWAQARSVSAETLIVWGTDDRLVSVSVAPRALAAFRHSRLLVLPEIGHVAQMERPETVARAFLALREDTDAQRARDAR